MGENNPRARKSADLTASDPLPKADPPSSKAPVPSRTAPEALAASSAPDPDEVEPKPQTRKTVQRGRRKSVPAKKQVDSASISGSLSNSGSASMSGGWVSASLSGQIKANGEVDEEAMARQALARKERIERAEAKERRKHRRRIARRVILGVVLFLAAVFAALLVAFGIFRWQTYDDAADIQGTWVHEGTTMPITITEDEIVLTDEVSYKYVLDPEAKTILFRFGNMEGGGRYRFSLDRQELAITDGEFDQWASFFDDALWTAESLFNQYVLAQETPLVTPDERTSVFHRE